eukprot:TRINITY_DN19247_c0_g1_i1.p1 TRINITY_DN19247_c0_g1~~TRINITY_DN19247_c0_g1_i1.p1  ORF type:complete len:649 (+),score=95.41 TRINITY_DN19247_c0_g1_i1:35-1981(+)
MWARRCGAPPTWPSRTRVLFHSCMSGAIGSVVFTFMNNLNAGSLDATSGRPGNATCLTHWLMRNGITNLHDTEEWDRWFLYKANADAFLDAYSCMPASRNFEVCNAAHIPMQAIHGSLGVALGGTESRGFGQDDTLQFFAWLFLVLGVVNFLGFLIHDLTLLHSVHKDYILDWPGLNEGFPFFQNFVIIAGFRMLRLLFTAPGQKRKRAGRVLGVLLTPLVAVWSLFVFLCILSPVMLLLCVRYPVRLSRFYVFVALLCTAIYGLFLTITQAVYWSIEEIRPRYAVVWPEPSITAGTCYCGCAYAISTGSIVSLLFIGLGVTIQSLLVGFRCLKGLRRSQWANLMTVTFSVPVAVYEVLWAQPNGEPIKHRNKGEPVQAERAFDAFALMDEQPESRYTTVTLKPEFAYEVKKSGRWRPLGLGRTYVGPKLLELKKGEMHLQPTEVIGCCGFPCMTGGYQAIIVSDSEDEDEEHGRPSTTFNGEGDVTSSGGFTSNQQNQVSVANCDECSHYGPVQATVSPDEIEHIRSTNTGNINRRNKLQQRAHEMFARLTLRALEPGWPSRKTKPSKHKQCQATEPRASDASVPAQGTRRELDPLTHLPSISATQIPAPMTREEELAVAEPGSENPAAKEHEQDREEQADASSLRL